MQRIITYTISTGESGENVLGFLRKKGFSKHILTTMKRAEQAILLNGQPAFGRTVLREGDVLRILVPEETGEGLESPILPVPLPLDILYEDEDILVLNKPADMPVHPSAGNYENTLANGVAWYYKQQGKAFVYRCINRLDRDTTGVLVLAKNPLSGALLSAQMKQLTKRGGTRSAEELLELVGLDPKRTLESYPHELSGGQRQRVLIAMALTRDPKLVICDEPTTALDVTVQKQVIKLLNDLQAKLGFAMIFVSHDLALVAEVAHNITVMYAGQVIEQAPTKELLTNPIHEYTRGLLGSVLSIESGSGRLHQVPGAVPSPRDFPKGDRFAPRSSHPRIGLDTRPVFKRVPGTEHFYSELPDEVLKANGLTPHAEVM